MAMIDPGTLTVTMTDNRLAVSEGAEFLVRSVASAFDAPLAHSAATHSRAA
jgi:oxygen-independent coproporphyrinogen III oxidase